MFTHKSCRGYVVLRTALPVVADQISVNKLRIRVGQVSIDMSRGRVPLTPYCPSCGSDVPVRELNAQCTRCGESLPVSALYKAKAGAGIYCQACLDTLATVATSCLADLLNSEASITLDSRDE